MEEELILNIFISAVCLLLILLGFYYIIKTLSNHREVIDDVEPLVATTPIRDGIQIQFYPVGSALPMKG